MDSFDCFSGCSWSTKGSELEQQQAFFWTIWCVPLYKNVRLNFPMKKFLQWCYFLNQCRWGCCLCCQWLAHSSPPMLLKINVPIQGTFHECEGNLPVELRPSEICLAWMSDCTVADIAVVNSIMTGCLLHP
jgi:hypothetical protein